MDTALAQKIAKNMKIPPRPDVLMVVTRETQHSSPEPKIIIDAISKDISLSSAMLQVVNSPFFGLVEKITSIDQAVHLLGPHRVEKVVTTVAMRNTIGSKLKLTQFWMNAIQVADVARTVANYLSGIDPDDAYTLGLFHDCGMPLMMQKFVTYTRTYNDSAAKDIKPFTALEDSRYRVNHAEVGAILCEQWFLPDRITQAVRLHHHHYENFESTNPEDESHMLLLGVLKMAEHIVARYHATDTDSHEWNVIGDEVLSYMGISTEDYDNVNNQILDMLRECEY